MFYKKRSTILFRNYGDFGYLTDNRNFGYRFSGTNIVGDKILSQSGAILLECLGDKIMTIEEVAERSIIQFRGVSFHELVHDTGVLFNNLASDGFLIKSVSIDGCMNSQPCLFEKEKTKGCRTTQPLVSTQAFFHEHFKNTPFPTSIHIEIASACNERCVHCFIPNEDKVDLMSYELFISILKQCDELKLLHITLSGGEPFLNPRLKDMLSLCRKHNYSVNLLSNLTSIDDEIIEEMSKNPLLGVQASLYSVRPDVHNSITGLTGSCEKTKHAITRLVENGIPVQISCPIIKQNFKFYKEVVDWGAKYSISVSADHVIIGEYNNSANNIGCRLDFNEVESFFYDKLLDVEFIDRLEEELDQNRQRSMDDFLCNVCMSSLCVGVNGDVFPCAGWQRCTLGNIQNSTLKEIWYYSEKASQLRSFKRKNIEKCVSCDAKDFCTVCMVRNANESKIGNPLEPNRYFCEIARIKKNVFIDR